MTAIIVVPMGALAVLQAVAEGRGPWHGWDATQAAKTVAGRGAAHRTRRHVIFGCRDLGLLTDHNILTQRGRDALKAWPHG
ncbi:hypothetical protein ACFPIF_09865 [Brevundimonas faecalis]|uniref:hypothetical protein n=1 Tax=Brevundimonas faecalis TaxID=947378 RepID=UPI00361E7154